MPSNGYSHIGGKLAQKRHLLLMCVCSHTRTYVGRKTLFCCWDSRVQLRKRTVEAIDSAAMLARRALAVVERESTDFCSAPCRNRVFTPQRRQSRRHFIDNTLPNIGLILELEFLQSLVEILPLSTRKEAYEIRLKQPASLFKSNWTWRWTWQKNKFKTSPICFIPNT